MEEHAEKSPFAKQSESEDVGAAWQARALIALEAAERAEQLITYGELADTAGISGSHRIQRLAAWLEHLIEQDAGAGRSLRAARVISRVRGGLPAPGFFIKCRELGLYDGPAEGEKAIVFHLNCLG